MNNTQPDFSPDNIGHSARPSQISAADQHEFEAATLRLRNALLNAGAGTAHSDVANARQNLRAIAVKLRDAGFWRSDKQGLRATVSLLWEADRFVNDKALLQAGGDAR